MNVERRVVERLLESGAVLVVAAVALAVAAGAPLAAQSRGHAESAPSDRTAVPISSPPSFISPPSSDGPRTAEPSTPAPPPPSTPENSGGGGRTAVPSDPSPPSSTPPSSPGSDPADTPRTAHPGSPEGGQRQPSNRHGGGHGDGGGQGGYIDPGYYYGPSWYDPFFGWGYIPPSPYPAAPPSYSPPDPGRRANMGALDLDVSPGSAEVYLDGEAIGTATRFDGWPGYLWLEQGTYDLAFYKQGYKTLKLRITVEPGMVTDIDDKMQKGEAVLPE
jgi:PEGA domain-containing protein